MREGARGEGVPAASRAAHLCSVEVLPAPSARYVAARPRPEMNDSMQPWVPAETDVGRRSRPGRRKGRVVWLHSVAAPFCSREDAPVDDDAAADARPQRRAEDDVRTRPVEVGRRRGRAVDRLREDEALGVVREPDRAPQGGLQILVERPVVEALQVRVPDEPAARLQEPGRPDPDGLRADSPTPVLSRSTTCRIAASTSPYAAGVAMRSRAISRPSPPSRSPSILVPPTSMPIRTPPRWHPQPRLCKCADRPVTGLHLRGGRGQNTRHIVVLAFASLACALLPSRCRSHCRSWPRRSCWSRWLPPPRARSRA